MRRPIFACLLSAWLLLGVGAASSSPQSDPPAPSPPDIILPDNPAPAPPPPPPPSPGTPTKLPAGVLYVVRSKSPCVVLGSQDGVLKITADAGPMKVMARFVDDPSKIQSRTFAEKYLYFVEVGNGGLAELIVIPAGATEAKQIIRRMIDAGQGPQPPPVPVPPIPPGPAPVPVPADPALVSAIQAAYTAEPAAQKATWLLLLRELYLSAPDKEVKDPTFPTVADLLTRLAQIRQRLPIADNEFLGVRNTIAAWLGQRLPPDPKAAPLDDATRAKVAGLFRAVAASLEGVK